MNTREKYIIFLEKLTNKFEEVEFSCFGVDWWPLIKIELGYYFHKNINNKQIKSDNNLSLTYPTKSINIRTALLIILYKLKPKYKINVGVFTHSIHKIPIKNKLVNIYTDPFVEKLCELNIDYKLDDFQNPNQNINISLLKYYYDKITINTFNANTNFQNKILELQTFIHEELNSDFNFYSLLTKSIINSQAFHKAYLLYFRKYRYNKVLFYCYYSSETMALIRAAQALNIKTIEYQHSSISKYHFAYGGWSDRINKSESFFPSIFWAWSNTDAEVITNTFKALPNLNTYVGGNLFLQSFKKNSTKSNNIILVTLQGIPLPIFLINYISLNKDFKWYIRQHPRYPLDKKIIEEFQFKNPDNIEMEDANKLSLYELLSMASYHITCYSGTAIEAQEFGIQNIIFGEDGYNSYKQQIENGSFLYVNNAKEVDEILYKKQSSNSSIPTNKIDTNSILKEIFS